VPVLIGRGFPHRSAPGSFERYCRLMLILFKPWRSPFDLKKKEESWPRTFTQFCDSDNMNYQHLQIINNINMLHECKESRDL
ncbi:hypothetical protein F5887DRAFT_870252, partial [Amanita rubescens]